MTMDTTISEPRAVGKTTPSKRKPKKRKPKKPAVPSNGKTVDLKRSIKSSNWQNYKVVKLKQQPPTPKSNVTSILNVAAKLHKPKPVSNCIDSSQTNLELAERKNIQRTQLSLTTRPFIPQTSSTNRNQTSGNHSFPSTQITLNDSFVKLNTSENKPLPKGPVKIPPQSTAALANTNIAFLNQPNVIGLTGVRPILQQDLCVAIDCEMVGVHTGKESMLARVSLVNMNGQCIYDTFVAPVVRVVDYRTVVSGVRPQDIQHGADFEIVRQVVATLIHNRILVGHGLKHDLDTMCLTFPRKWIRDTSLYEPFRTLLQINKPPSLKRLAKELLNLVIQESEHSSIVDARAAMQLYAAHRQEWEASIRSRKFQQQ